MNQDIRSKWPHAPYTNGVAVSATTHGLSHSAQVVSVTTKATHTMNTNSKTNSEDELYQDYIKALPQSQMHKTQSTLIALCNSLRPFVCFSRALISLLTINVTTYWGLHTYTIIQPDCSQKGYSTGHTNMLPAVLWIPSSATTLLYKYMA